MEAEEDSRRRRLVGSGAPLSSARGGGRRGAFVERGGGLDAEGLGEGGVEGARLEMFCAGGEKGEPLGKGAQLLHRSLPRTPACARGKGDPRKRRSPGGSTRAAFRGVAFLFACLRKGISDPSAWPRRRLSPPSGLLAWLAALPLLQSPRCGAGPPSPGLRLGSRGVASKAPLQCHAAGCFFCRRSVVLSWGGGWAGGAGEAALLRPVLHNAKSFFQGGLPV